MCVSLPGPHTHALTWLVAAAGPPAGGAAPGDRAGPVAACAAPGAAGGCRQGAGRGAEGQGQCRLLRRQAARGSRAVWALHRAGRRQPHLLEQPGGGEDRAEGLPGGGQGRGPVHRACAAVGQGLEPAGGGILWAGGLLAGARQRGGAGVGGAHARGSGGLRHSMHGSRAGVPWRALQYHFVAGGRGAGGPDRRWQEGRSLRRGLSQAAVTISASKPVRACPPPCTPHAPLRLLALQFFS